MSNYRAPALNPRNGRVETARHLDNYFGLHVYGVAFDGDDTVYKTHLTGLEAAGEMIDQLMSERNADKALIKELVEALRDLRLNAALLQQNSEGCAVNHYGSDFETHGMPGWLSDTQASIDRALTVLAKVQQ